MHNRFRRRGPPSGKARRGSKLGICDRGATPPDGMPRREVVVPSDALHYFGASRPRFSALFSPSLRVTRAARCRRSARKTADRGVAHPMTISLPFPSTHYAFFMMLWRPHTHPDVVATLGGGKARQTRTQEGPERVDGATAGLTDNRFEFGEAELDGVEVGAVGRQEPQRRAGGCNGGLHPLDLVGRDIVRDHDVPGL